MCYWVMKRFSFSALPQVALSLLTVTVLSEVGDRNFGALIRLASKGRYTINEEKVNDIIFSTILTPYLNEMVGKLGGNRKQRNHRWMVGKSLLINTIFIKQTCIFAEKHWLMLPFTGSILAFTTHLRELRTDTLLGKLPINFHIPCSYSSQW